MIREIVSSIVEAEKTAEEIVAAAHADYAKTVTDAEEKADVTLVSVQADVKYNSKKQQSEALMKAEAAAGALIEKGRIAAEDKNKKFEKNLEIAINAVTEKLIKKWQ